MTPATVLSAIVAMLAAAASAGGMLIPDLYRDNTWITSAWRGNDLVTLVVAVPLLAAAPRLARRGSARAQLLWLAMLAYMIYGYAYYLFGAAFNRFFLLYVAIFALSILGLLYTVSALDLRALGRAFHDGLPARPIAAYLLLLGAGLGLAWIGISLSFVVSGKVPAVIVASGHPTGIVFAIDLSMLVPGFLLAGLWTWRRQPRGYVLASVMTIKGATYTLALAAASIVASRAGVAGAAAEIPLWLSLTLASLVASGLLLARTHLRPAS